METSFSIRLEQFLAERPHPDKPTGYERLRQVASRLDRQLPDDLLSAALVDLLEHPGTLNGYHPFRVVCRRMRQIRSKGLTTTKRRRSDGKVVRVGLDVWSQWDADCKPDIIWKDDIAVFFHNGRPDSGRRVSPGKPLYEYESPAS